MTALELFLLILTRQPLITVTIPFPAKMTSLPRLLRLVEQKGNKNMLTILSFLPLYC